MTCGAGLLAEVSSTTGLSEETSSSPGSEDPDPDSSAASNHQAAVDGTDADTGQPTADEPRHPVLDLLLRAQAAAKAGQFDFARVFLDAAVVAPQVSSTGRAKAYFLRGSVLMEQGLPTAAAIDFARAKQFDPLNARVLSAIAYLHYTGAGLTKNDARAIELYRTASDLGLAEAQRNLALMHLRGHGMPADLDAGRALLKQASDQGDAAAMVMLGNTYLHPPAPLAGDTTQAIVPGREPDVPALAEPNPEIARNWFIAASEVDGVSGLVELGHLAKSGHATSPDSAAAIGYYRQAADAGSSRGTSALAYSYAQGEGVERDESRAQALYELAAEGGDSYAMTQLGYRSAVGLGTKQDAGASMQWYLRAAEAGNFTAQSHLGRMYLGNLYDGTTLSAAQRSSLQRRALRWLGAAATSGDVPAANSLAWLLATSQDEALRDGTRSLALADQAVRKQPRAEYIDTLAAAHAEVGDFEAAVLQQIRAIDLARQDTSAAALVPELQRRLEHYQRGEPWRD